MADLKRRQLNRKEIEACLKSAVSELTPNVLSRIDLNAPQLQEEKLPRSVFIIRQRVIASFIAACFCLIALAGGTYTYQNGKVDSVIGIDVNPSVELSVNKKNKVLSAEPLNEDAKNIMQDMDLKGVDLNIAVNAVIGSMVTHGYLKDLDNAILVTVSNDSVSKAKSIRSAVVNDIQDTLEKKQLKAVVYDQQVIEEDEVKKLADEYQISYGKAYFLKELISQNSSLSMSDMKEMASLTMEEIAKVITERAYAVGEFAAVTDETTQEETTTLEETIVQTATEEISSSAEISTETASTEASAQTVVQSTQNSVSPPTSVPSSSAEESVTQEEVVSTEKIKIDYVDYENGVVMVYFKNKVKWKNPTVSVNDDDGNTYSAKVSETDSDYCEINVSGLAGGVNYTFVLGGISPKIGKQTTVKGFFETPVFGNGEADQEETESESEEETQTSVLETTESETESTSSKETQAAQKEAKTTQTEKQTTQGAVEETEKTSS